MYGNTSLNSLNVQEKKFRGNKITLFISNNFFSENCAVYENMWKKYGKAIQAADENIIRRMRIACWITKVRHTHTHIEYVITTAFRRQNF